jgi:bifunctional DNA-binding transcriptional regulator/antitoxin component of YhaV-PrlF toxin-antitoxin module
MTDSNVAEYTLRIAGKRQVTLPEDVLTALDLKQGDEFRIVVRNPSDIRLVPYARIRRDLITPEIEEILKKRRAEIENGAEMISQEELLKRAAVKNAQRRIRSQAKPAARAVLQEAECGFEISPAWGPFDGERVRGNLLARKTTSRIL